MSLRDFFSSEGQRSALLHEYYSNSFPEGITFQEKKNREFWKGQDRSGAHDIFQFL
jgi:hypothetical protein